MNREDYCEWSIFYHGDKETGKYRAYWFGINELAWQHRLLKRPGLKITDHIMKKSQIGLFEFIVEETISRDRKQQNVISSVMKFLKRLDRI